MFLWCALFICIPLCSHSEGTSLLGGCPALNTRCGPAISIQVQQTLNNQWLSPRTLDLLFALLIFYKYKAYKAEEVENAAVYECGWTKSSASLLEKHDDISDCCCHVSSRLFALFRNRSITSGIHWFYLYSLSITAFIWLPRFSCQLQFRFLVLLPHSNCNQSSLF